MVQRLELLVVFMTKSIRAGSILLIQFDSHIDINLFMYIMTVTVQSLGLYKQTKDPWASLFANAFHRILYALSTCIYLHQWNLTLPYMYMCDFTLYVHVRALKVPRFLPLEVVLSSLQVPWSRWSFWRCAGVTDFGVCWRKLLSRHIV